MGNYDDALKQIDFYKLHPSYLPFIGSDYDKYRILHIGESHYCDSMDIEQFGINYFFKWFDEPCNEVETDLLNNNITRRVANGIVNNECHFTIFDNVLRSFIRIMKDEQNPRISNENRKEYKYFAFMNYYPFPAFEPKGNFLQSLRKLSKMKNNKDETEKLICKAEYEATNIVDQVIDILNPNCIAFTSCAAWKSYKNKNGKYVNDERMIYTSHPGKPVSWNKALPILENQKGIDVFESGLKRIYHK